MSTQWHKSGRSKVYSNPRLKRSQQYFNQSEIQQDLPPKRLRRRTRLSSSFDLFISAFGICFVAMMAALTTTSVIPVALHLTLTMWIVTEIWFWMTSVLRGEGEASNVKNSVNRTFYAFALWLFVGAFEFEGNLLLMMSKLLYVYLWSESVYKGLQNGRIYDQNHHSAKYAEEKLLGFFAIISSVSTLLLWRAHELSTAVDLSAVLVVQAPLVIGVSTYWLSYIRRTHMSWVKQATDYLKYCGFALMMTLMTVYSRESDSVFRHTLLILSIAGVVLFYVSYLLPNRALWSSKTRTLQSPLRSLSLSFISLCTLGTGLLMLPAVTLDGRGLSFIEAAFTSVSASCITGLSIIDISKLSGLGQGIILCLIQVGGFGIVLLTHMLFSATLRKQKSVNDPSTSSQFQKTHEKVHHGVAHLGDNALANPSSAARLFTYVLTIELMAALLLMICFLREDLALSEAFWRGVFTSISAFCNAGFALQSDSFMSYTSSQMMLYTISFTVFFGGIGPTVIFELIDRQKIKGAKPPLSYFSKLVLVGSITLFIIPALIFCLLEWNQAFAHLNPLDKITNAFFHSTSLRTAGFNSVDLAQLSDGSWSLSLVLMLMGGSPLSTAGGVKVTTMLIAFASLFPLLRGQKKSVLMNRAHPLSQSSKAVATLLFSLLIVFFVMCALQMSGEILDIKVLMFEVISALGTVGLSMGGTSMVSPGGLWLIMFCMFLGRIGPPALLLSFSERTTINYEETYIDEKVPLS